ncbi:winged helix DNA-binding domain-containing protein, partial [Candidatus Bathyarchaeota archaeon]|nr:winged helix DNA-binding domain-containing protein [Candidatus Bathyarchaeota archaeon]
MKVSRNAVRRLQLERQGIGVFPRSVDKKDVFEAVDRLGCIQIDTISVVERAHHFTLWSRLGCYDKRLLYDLAYEDRRVYEGLGHAASYLPLKDWRYFIHANRVRAEDYATHRGWFADTDPGMLELVLKRIRKEGPLASRDFEENKPQGGWWSWKPSKTALEALFSTGTLMVSYRENFQRFYDLTERVLPSWVDTSEPTKEERLRFFVTRTMGCLGAIRPSDIRGYYYDRCVKLERSVRELSAFLDGLVTEDEAVKL